MATYTISNLAQLQDMNSHLNDDCVLMNDINAADTTGWNWNVTRSVYEGFIPIGTGASPFTGTFDGGGHTISNLYMNWNDRWCGLFGAILRTAAADGGFVKDLTLSNVNITHGDAANACCALSGSVQGKSASYGEYSNIHVTGTLAGGSSCAIGGLFYSSVYANWTDCTADLTINVGYTAGGFGSSVSAGTYLRCHASGSIIQSGSGAPSIGGFARTTAGTATTLLRNCSSDVDIVINNTHALYITSTQGVGGFTGYINGGKHEYCSASGSIIANGNGYALIGGFIGGYNTSYGIFECYADVQIECPIIGGTFAAVSYIGGFFGGNGYASDCYARGNVCASGIQNNGVRDVSIGGFAGLGSYATRCYSIGEVGPDVPGTGTTVIRGGFSGGTWGTPTYSFWDTETSGMSAATGSGAKAGITGKTTDEMKTEATYTTWDFVTKWEFV